MGPEPDCYRTYERTDTADWEAITGPPLKHSENAGPWLHQLHQACSQQHETGVCLVALGQPIVAPGRAIAAGHAAAAADAVAAAGRPAEGRLRGRQVADGAGRRWRRRRVG